MFVVVLRMTHLALLEDLTKSLLSLQEYRKAARKGCARSPYMEMDVLMQISNIERSLILEISEFINIRIRLRLH